MKFSFRKKLAVLLAGLLLISNMNMIYAEETGSFGPVILTAQSGSKVYDGTALTIPQVTAEGLPEGFTVEAAANGFQLDAGSSENVVGDGYIIRDAGGSDRTAEFEQVTKVNGVLTVEPAPLTVVTESAVKAFDGKELRAPGSISGFVSVGGVPETAELIVYGLQTLIGSSRNEYDIFWTGTAKRSNYVVFDSVGTLTVTESADEVVVTTTGGSFQYDGQPHGASVQVYNLPEGLTVAKAASAPVVTNAGDGTVAVSADELSIINETGLDVTSQLKLRYENDTIQILPRTIRISSESAEKMYDGAPLTTENLEFGGIALSGDGFAEGDGIAVTRTGAQTAVGSSPNTFEYALTLRDAAHPENYIVEPEEGILTVTENTAPVTLTAASAAKSYDGTPLTAADGILSEGLPEGFWVEGTVEGSLTDAGSIESRIADFTIYNPQGEDATAFFEQVNCITGILTVTPAVLTVRTESAAKEYDGSPLTAGGSVAGLAAPEGVVETLGFTVVGSLQDPGSAVNGYVLEWNGTAKPENYTVVEELGTLTVTGDPDAILVIAGETSFLYDGKEHEPAFTVKNLPEGLTAQTASKVRVRNVSDGTVSVGADDCTLTILDADGNDVTEQYAEHIRFLEGTIRIQPRSLTIASASAEKIFDYDELTTEALENQGIVISGDGLAEGDELSVTLTGSRSELGSSDNTFEYAFAEGVDPGNYTVETVFGTLTVKQLPIEVEIQVPPTEGVYSLSVKVPFLFIVHNVSGEDLQGVTLVDYTAEFEEADDYTITDGKVIADIPADGYLYVSAAHVITSEDILKGEYRNNALITTGDTEIRQSVLMTQIDEVRTDLAVEGNAINPPENEKSFSLGELVLYRLTLANNGNVPFTNVRIIDVLTGLREVVDTLLAGESRSYLTTYEVKEEDVKKGFIANRVAASADEVVSPRLPEDITPGAEDTSFVLTGEGSAKPLDPDQPETPDSPSEPQNPAEPDGPSAPEVPEQPAEEGFRLEIRYYLGGMSVFAPFIATYEPGSSYNVASPALEGCTPSAARVEGQINADTVLNVYYTLNTYTLRVNYLNTAGEAVAPATVQTFAYGDVYSVQTPQFAGYSASTSVVNGTMPGRNVEVTVFYAPSAAPVQQTADTAETTLHRSLTQFGIELTGNEVIIEEYKTPLGLSGVVAAAGECFE